MEGLQCVQSHGFEFRSLGMHVVLGCYPERFSDFVFSMENKGDFWDERLEGMGVDGGFWVEVQANLTVEFLLDGGRIGGDAPFYVYGFFYLLAGFFRVVPTDGMGYGQCFRLCFGFG
ncbi:hypothetical protein I3760_03G214200 [Carya illinoinensis]|nr:hypothetical protein I3760_03G214200 [Carya illinoinensis]